MCSGERKKIDLPYSVAGYEQTGSYTDEDDGDRKVLAQMEEMGADLTKKRHIVHYLYFDSDSRADAACADLEKMGFEASGGEELQAELRSLRWPVTAERIEVINEDVIRRLRKPLKRIAEQHGGEYDGWEASSE